MGDSMRNANISDQAESFLSFLFDPITNLFDNQTRHNIAKGLKSAPDKKSYIDNTLSLNGLVDEFNKFVNSPEQTIENIGEDILRTFQTNTLVNSFSDQSMFKSKPITIGNKVVKTKADIQNAHNIILDKINTTANNNKVSNIVNSDLHPRKKYSKIKNEVHPSSKTASLTKLGEMLDFTTSYKKYFNVTNFPLFLSALIIFLIGWYTSYEMFKESKDLYPILSNDTILGVFISIMVISALICIKYKYDIITGLSFALMLSTIMLVICQYNIMFNYNKLAEKFNREITASDSDEESDGDSSTPAPEPTKDDAKLECDPFGKFPPSCINKFTPAERELVNKLNSENNERYRYIQAYLSNNKKNVLSYTTFLFIVIITYVLTYVLLFYRFPSYDKHMCYLAGIGAGLIYIAYYFSTGYVPIPNDDASIDRFQNLDEILNSLFGAHWVIVCAWMVVLIFISFVLLYWGAKNYNITSSNIWFNSIFMIVVVLIIGFSIVMFTQLRKQNTDGLGNLFAGVTVVNKNILYVLIALIALSILFMAGIVRKLYKRNNK